MSASNPLNVYSGDDSVKKYFNPDEQPPLPLVEIPAALNPYRDRNVRIFAKMMTILPAHNVKALPAINLLSECVVPGETKSVVEYSSGSTVISMSMAARVFHGIQDSKAFLSNKTTEAKLRLMQFFGLELTLFGGPAQPEPTDHRGGIHAARTQAARNHTVINPNQYENEANWKAHHRWTGPQILRQKPDLNVICTGMGTTGTMTGIGTFMKEKAPSVCRVGVCTASGDRVPGPRSYSLMDPVKFPWRDAVDAIEEVGSPESFTLSLQLSRAGLVCGPSSGFNLQGLRQFLDKRIAEDTLDELRGPSGEVICVFLCCDLPYQYIDEYFEKVDQAHFRPIKNRNLSSVDKYRYDEAWEREVDVLADFYEFGRLKSQHVVLDLRKSAHFALDHLGGSRNVPVASISDSTCSPFSDAQVLEKQWLELEGIFAGAQTGMGDSSAWLKGKRVLLVCYNGDSSKVATSILRAKGIAAESIRGGAKTLARVQGHMRAEIMKAQSVAPSISSAQTELKIPAEVTSY